MDFDYENDKKKPHCPVVDVDGVIANGKQFDLDITLPHDNRDVIYGIIKNCFKEPVADAVVKLVEIDTKMGKEERKPVSHTFTDKNGEFVFGPLCPGKEYAIQIWVDDVKHVKVCAKTFHEGKCLKGIKLDKCDKDYDKPHYDDECKDKDYDKKPHNDDECKDKEYDKKTYYEDECKCNDYDKNNDKKDDTKDEKKDDKKDCKYNKYYYR